MGLAFKVRRCRSTCGPDVYEGASTPVAALMSAGVKAAAFAALVRVFLAFAPAGLAALWCPSRCWRCSHGGRQLLAMPQRNVKRMLAYSSIAHAGYILVGVTALFVTAPPRGLRVAG